MAKIRAMTKRKSIMETTMIGAFPDDLGGLFLIDIAIDTSTAIMIMMAITRNIIKAQDLRGESSIGI
jgi:hypothetical protein